MSDNELSIMSPSDEVIPDGWTIDSLSSIVEINPKRPKLNCLDDQPTTFIPMNKVNEETGKIKSPIIRKYSEVKKGYTYFEENDIIFSGTPKGVDKLKVGDKLEGYIENEKILNINII